MTKRIATALGCVFILATATACGTVLKRLSYEVSNAGLGCIDGVSTNVHGGKSEQNWRYGGDDSGNYVGGEVQIHWDADGSECHN